MDSARTSRTLRSTDPGGPAANPGVCASCGAPLTGRFCAACGERRLDPRDFGVRRFLARALHDVADVDGRLPRSLGALVARPGLLTADFMRGRRRPWLSPLQLFLLANLLYFVLLSIFGGFDTFTTQLRYHRTQPIYGGTAAALLDNIGPVGSPEYVEFEQRFNEATPRYANSLVILVVPILAGMLALLLVRVRTWFVHHLVFTLHYMTFLLLATLTYAYALAVLLAFLPSLRAWLAAADSEFIVTLPLLCTLTAWLTAALGRAYGFGTWAALAAGAAATALTLPAIMIYRGVLFFVVYFSLR